MQHFIPYIFHFLQHVPSSIGHHQVLHKGPRLPSGAQRDGGRTQDLANRRPAPNGRPKVHLLDTGTRTRTRLQTT
jgi:hypothetical protein